MNGMDGLRNDKAFSIYSTRIAEMEREIEDLKNNIDMLEVQLLLKD